MSKHFRETRGFFVERNNEHLWRHKFTCLNMNFSLLKESGIPQDKYQQLFDDASFLYKAMLFNISTSWELRLLTSDRSSFACCFKHISADRRLTIAAGVESLEFLDFIKTQFITGTQSTFTDDQFQMIMYIAVMKKSRKLMNWLFQHTQHMVWSQDIPWLSPASFALHAQDPDFFNEVLNSCKDPSHIVIQYRQEYGNTPMPELLRTLDEALEKNRRLQTISIIFNENHYELHNYIPQLEYMPATLIPLFVTSRLPIKQEIPVIHPWYMPIHSIVKILDCNMLNTTLTSMWHSCVPLMLAVHHDGDDEQCDSDLYTQLNNDLLKYIFSILIALLRQDCKEIILHTDFSIFHKRKEIELLEKAEPDRVISPMG